jgi:uncharacterized protein YjgD (DUF1641 family)
MSFSTGKTNIERVENEIIKISEHFKFKINIKKWKNMNQFGFMNPKKLALSILMYENGATNKQEIKNKLKNFTKKNEYERLVNNIIDVYDSKQVIDLKAVMIKYLTNMINHISDRK